MARQLAGVLLLFLVLVAVTVGLMATVGSPG